MASANVQNVRLVAGSSAVFMARVVKDDGSVLTQSDLESSAYGDSITCSIHDADTGEETDTPAVSNDSLSNTTTKNAAWTRDSTGFNFSCALDGSNWPTPGATYEIAFIFVCQNGRTIKVIFRAQVLPLVS